MFSVGWLSDKWSVPSREHSESFVVITIRGWEALLLIEHQLLHLFLQVLLVDGCRVKSIAHKLRHPRTCRHLLLVLPLRLGVTRTVWWSICGINRKTPAHLQLLTFWMSLMETGGVLGLTLSIKANQRNSVRFSYKPEEPHWLAPRLDQAVCGRVHTACRLWWSFVNYH